MAKWAPKLLLLVYGLFVAVVLWRAWIKYGGDGAGFALFIGLGFLVVLWRVWRTVRYVLFGGRTPYVTPGQSTQFVPPKSK